MSQAQADITVADAQIVRTLDDQVRYKKLAANGTEPIQSFEHADAEYKQAVASGLKARAGVVAAQQQLRVIDTEKLKVQAALEQAVAEEETAPI